MVPPTHIRDRISRQHESIGEFLDELADLAEGIIRGNEELTPLVDRRVRQLRTDIARHHALESQALMPTLARGNGWGVILARHLAEVHRHQLGLVERAADAVETCDPLDRAVQVRILAQALRDDLRQEERWMALLPGGMGG